MCQRKTWNWKIGQDLGRNPQKPESEVRKTPKREEKTLKHGKNSTVERNLGRNPTVEGSPSLSGRPGLTHLSHRRLYVRGISGLTLMVLIKRSSLSQSIPIWRASCIWFATVHQINVPVTSETFFFFCGWIYQLAHWSVRITFTLTDLVNSHKLVC